MSIYQCQTHRPLIIRSSVIRKVGNTVVDIEGIFLVVVVERVTTVKIVLVRNPVIDPHRELMNIPFIRWRRNEVSNFSNEIWPWEFARNGHSDAVHPALRND